MSRRYESNRRLRGSAAISAARNAPPIELGATVLRFGFRGIEVPSPLVEFVSQRVQAPSVIYGAETLLLRHYLDGNELCGAELMS